MLLDKPDKPHRPIHLCVLALAVLLVLFGVGDARAIGIYNCGSVPAATDAGDAVCWDSNTKAFKYWASGAWNPITLKGISFTLGFDFMGTPAASAVEGFVCPATLTFPANLATPNSYVSCGANPAEADAYTVKVNGSSIGTVSISTSCVGTFTTTGGASQTCTAGQRLEIDVPSIVSGTNIIIGLTYTQ